ncbi:hypothetical protein HC928_20630 [bacterium]|nr:hypothetical protein [bacterium]
MPAFVDALRHEIAIVGGSRPPLQAHTIYFGGGTPSLLLPSHFAVLFGALHRYFDILPECEITVEA